MKKTSALVLAGFALSVLAPAWGCNHGRPCFELAGDISLAREPYGATDISVASGNRGLSIGVNREGTLTLFKWPNPSFYDQVKYMTGPREAGDLGALANEGAFAGVRYETDDGRSGFFWLRDALAGQAYSGDLSAVAVTEFREKASGLSIRQLDFVDPDKDVLWRIYQVEKAPGSRVQKAALVSYANMSPTVTKYASMPIRDWCMDEVGSSDIVWREEADAFLHYKVGRDWSADRERSVFLGMGFHGKSSSRQAGHDSRCSAKRFFGKKDAYEIASRGELPGADRAKGRVTAGISKELEFDGSGKAGAAFIISAAGSESGALGLMEDARKEGPAEALARAEKHWLDLTSDAPLPDTDDQRIMQVAKRSVVSVYQGFAKDTGAAVASLSTQPPYGLDWPRDGAFLNLAMIESGFPGLARQRLLFIANAQSRPGNKIKRVPEGNWASNYYADGVPGFPILWWEIDETGWGIWSLVYYYEVSGDLAYLESVYPALKRAADFLVEFKDPKTGLHKKAYENDWPEKRSTIHGAMPNYLGLNYAAMAARAMGDDESAARWEARSSELKSAILDLHWDPACGGRFVDRAEHRGDCRIEPSSINAALLLWPCRVLEPGSPKAEAAAEQAWESVAKSFNGERDHGSYEPYTLLCLAKYWEGRPDKLELIKKGLAWCARTPVTETGHFGEVWVTVDGKISPGEGQPHLWHHSLFYLASLAAFGPK